MVSSAPCRRRDYARRGALYSLVGIALLATMGACRRAPKPLGPAAEMVDGRATNETRALFANLRLVAHDHVLFGHQDDLAYGVHWAAEPGRSDVKESAGDYPAVYGWELGRIEHASPANTDDVDFARMRRWIQEGYRRGGVITLSWRMSNPATKDTASDSTAAIASILPGGARHAAYRRSLDRVAGFVASLRGRNRAGNTTEIPVIVRPFPDMNGSSQWWGAGRATTEQYKQLWQFTVGYLRDRKKLHNILWAYSPVPTAGLAGHYFDWYPGDSWVDVLGVDEYFVSPDGSRTMADQRDTLAAHLRWLAGTAAARGKIAALTETGYLTVPDSAWWTQTLLPALHADSAGTHVAWALIGRNATVTPRGDAPFFAPYRGHGSESDFVRFHGDPLTWFERDLPDLYTAPAQR